MARTESSGESIILNSGTLSYESSVGSAGENRASAEVALNEIRTPYGRQLKVILPDATKVWLNAGSVIKFPAGFNPHLKRRWLEMSGEAYFEVAKRRNITGEPMPFIVKAGRQEVEVLGTHFDVKAYPDDTAIKTTLAEGKVRVHAAGMQAVELRPGQQSSFQVQANSIKVKEVDASAVTGWTRGLFVFHNASIEEVMHQFSRWYNVQVDYGDHLPQRTFSGKIYRNLNASEALAALSFMKLHFEILSRPEQGGFVIKVTP